MLLAMDNNFGTAKNRNLDYKFGTKGVCFSWVRSMGTHAASQKEKDTCNLHVSHIYLFLIIEKFSNYYIYLYCKLYFCIEINGVQRKRIRFSS